MTPVPVSDGGCGPRLLLLGRGQCCVNIFCSRLQLISQGKPMCQIFVTWYYKMWDNNRWSQRRKLGAVDLYDRDRCIFLILKKEPLIVGSGDPRPAWPQTWDIWLKQKVTKYVSQPGSRFQIVIIVSTLTAAEPNTKLCCRCVQLWSVEQSPAILPPALCRIRRARLSLQNTESN